MNFPDSIDSFTEKQDGLDFPQASFFNDPQDAIVAIQLKVGVDNSADTGSLDYLVRHMWETVYPVGCIYESTVATSPATLFGGTWVALGEGKVLVGYKSGDANFGTPGASVGEATHVLTEAELASHTHVQNAHAHTIDAITGSGSGVRCINAAATERTSPIAWTEIINNTTAVNQNTGSGTAHNNIQPSLVVYRWTRTA